tara:strand:- start:277 stop:519 length:243 start_codon:yes stop_codon:yes gene_type:complete
MNNSEMYGIQPLLNAGFTDMNGNEWGSISINQYNDYTVLINKSADRIVKFGSLLKQEREAYLNARHAFFITVCDTLNERV